MKRSIHYDVISGVYEYLTEKLHGGHRVEAIDLMRLETGQRVLDAPCGTGANFPSLYDKVGPTGRIIASDYSGGMLARAGRKVESAGWQNISLVQADARDLSPELIGTEEVDAAICMLGLTVIPEWELAFDQMYDLVRPGGRIVIMDLYLDGKRTSTVANGYYRVIAQAHSRRRFWEPLERRVADFETIEHQWFGGVAKIVAGTKPSDPATEATA